MIIRQDINTPPEMEEDWYKRWEGADQGLICAWLSGIAKATADPAMAERALNDELPVNGFRGGVDKPLKTKGKIGSLHYLAYWQGLRSDDLCIDQSAEPVLTCSRHGVTVTFTGNVSGLLTTQEPDESEP